MKEVAFPMDLKDRYHLAWPQNLQPVRQVTLGLQLAHLKNERLNLRVELPSSDTSLATHQNRSSGRIPNILVSSFPSSVKW